MKFFCFFLFTKRRLSCRLAFQLSQRAGYGKEQALARVSGHPLLFKGEDFVLADAPSALSVG